MDTSHIPSVCPQGPSYSCEYGQWLKALLRLTQKIATLENRTQEEVLMEVFERFRALNLNIEDELYLICTPISSKPLNTGIVTF